MSNYNEALDSEKRTLSLLVETSFYPQSSDNNAATEKSIDVDATLQAIQGNPKLARQILQLLLSNATKAPQ